jgi:8-oxo-dGTP diphosphatase
MSEVQKTVVSVIPVNPKGEVLLQQRDDRADLLYPGMWTFFGGAVEEAETPNDAINREIKEELGVELPLVYWMNYVCPARSVPNETTTTNYVYFTAINPDDVSLTLGEGQAMGWFDREKGLALDLAFLQSPILEQFFTAGLHEFGKQA